MLKFPDVDLTTAVIRYFALKEVSLHRKISPGYGMVQGPVAE